VDTSDNITLVRELEELTSQSPSKSREANPENEITLEGLMAIAERNGIGEQFRLFYDTATKHGLYPRLYKSSIMYTPPQHKNRCCMVAWVKPIRKLLKAYAVPEAFAEFFNISEQEATDILVHNNRLELNFSDTKQLCDRIDQLFQRIVANSE
jgi:hypothetical protein